MVKALARPAVRRQISRASEVPLLGWWNGRHVRLRGVCRKAWGFKSPPEHGLRAQKKSTNPPQARNAILLSNAASAQTSCRAPKQSRRTKGRRQHRLRLVRADHQEWNESGVPRYLQHLPVLQTLPAPLNQLAQPKSPSAHANDSQPDQRSSAHGFQKSSRRFPGRGAPVNSASRARPVSRFSPPTR